MTLSRAHEILKTGNDIKHHVSSVSDKYPDMVKIIDIAKARIKRFNACKAWLKKQHLEHLESRREYYPAAKFRHNKPGHWEGRGVIWLGYDPPMRKHYKQAG
jgi:hypothetical protein